jgi:hypothetical protein
VKGWLETMWKDYGSVLAEQNPEKIRRLSEHIWSNTQTRLLFDGTTSPQQWIALGTGHNLRWEIPGLIGCLVGLTAQSLMGSDTLFKEHSTSRASLTKKMSEAAESCISFCRECDTLDDMFIWLLIENHPLTSSIRGEGSFFAYSLSGEVNNAVVAKGLHQEIHTDARTPFFLAQIRKMAFIQVYGYDVSVAAFLGRPPRLSYRHCTIDLPLDLTDREVVFEGPKSQAVLEGLDEKGWKIHGKPNRTTWMRTWIGFAPRREDILDLSLGSYTREEVLRRAEEIQTLSEQQWANL